MSGIWDLYQLVSCELHIFREKFVSNQRSRFNMAGIHPRDQKISRFWLWSTHCMNAFIEGQQRCLHSIGTKLLQADGHSFSGGIHLCWYVGGNRPIVDYVYSDSDLGEYRKDFNLPLNSGSGFGSRQGIHWTHHANVDQGMIVDEHRW